MTQQAFPWEWSPVHPWVRVKRDDVRARLLADRHYSRQTIGAKGFVPPGRVLVLVTPDALAAWAVCENLDGGGTMRWRVTLFRNEGHVVSSELVRAATITTFSWWAHRYGEVPAELVTEVDAAKVRRKRDPGRCFMRAGWERIGDSKGGLVRLRAPHVGGGA